MALNKRGQLSNLAEQPDSELVYEQDGLIRGQRVLKGDKTYRAQVPALWSKHPEEPLALCFQRSIKRIKLNQIVATLDYIGVSKDPTDFIIGLNGSLSREPIQTHKDFVSIIGGTPDDPKNDALFDDETGEFIEFPVGAPNKMAGVSEYFEPSINIQRSWWTYRVPNPGTMGKFFGKPADIIVPPGVELIYGPFTYRQVGRLYQCSEELLGSGRNGVNRLVYP